MYKKIAELKVTKSADYYDEVVKALEKAGYSIVLESQDIIERYYIIAEKMEEKEN